MSDWRKQPPSFLGTGWAFPPTFTAGGAELALVSGPEDIRQSLEILLATRTGERPMQDSFGCDLDQAMFEEVDTALISKVSAAISDAILRHEPRIALNAVDVSQRDDDAGALTIRVDYTVLGTNSRYNMVYPFYLYEAVTPGA
jgi:phage baseplate assembly protein W